MAGLLCSCHGHCLNSDTFRYCKLFKPALFLIWIKSLSLTWQPPSLFLSLSPHPSIHWPMASPPPLNLLLHFSSSIHIWRIDFQVFLLRALLSLVRSHPGKVDSTLGADYIDFAELILTNQVNRVRQRKRVDCWHDWHPLCAVSHLLRLWN